MVGVDEQCPLQMARMCAHELLERYADPLIRDQWGRTHTRNPLLLVISRPLSDILLVITGTAEEFHRRRADLPGTDHERDSPQLWAPARGRNLYQPAAKPRGPSPFDSATLHAPRRDGRAVLIADMIRAKVERETGLLVAMQKLCWMRLLHRNHMRPEMSYGADSPAWCITKSPVPPVEEAAPGSAAGSRRSSVASAKSAVSPRRNPPLLAMSGPSLTGCLRSQTGSARSATGSARSGGSGSSGGSAGPPREVVYMGIVQRGKFARDLPSLCEA